MPTRLSNEYDHSDPELWSGFHCTVTNRLVRSLAHRSFRNHRRLHQGDNIHRKTVAILFEVQTLAGDQYCRWVSRWMGLSTTRARCVQVVQLVLANSCGRQWLVWMDGLRLPETIARSTCQPSMDAIKTRTRKTAGHGNFRLTRRRFYSMNLVLVSKVPVAGKVSIFDASFSL